MLFHIKNGFSLIELIAVILIIAILAVFAVPSFQQYMAKQEVMQTMAKLGHANQSAKNSALLHHANIVICPSSSLSQCQSSQWSRGFIVFIDLNKNRTVDAGEKILQTERLDLQYGTLDWKGTLSIPSLTFQAATGLPNGSNGGFYYCSLTDQPHQKLNLSRMGHLRLEKISAC